MPPESLFPAHRYMSINHSENNEQTTYISLGLTFSPEEAMQRLTRASNISPRSQRSQHVATHAVSSGWPETWADTEKGGLLVGAG